MPLRRHRRFWLLAGMALAGCASLPRILPYTDPLSPEEHVQLAGAYSAQGNAGLSQKQYEAALKKQKKSFPALMGLGNLAFEKGDWKRAEKYFRKALRVSPDNPGAGNNLAMTYLKEGKRLKEAQALVEGSLEKAGPLRPYLLDTLEQIRAARKKLE